MKSVLILEADKISASYGSLQVLRGVSIAVDSGQVALLIGRNGSGKSSTLKAIFGLLKLDSGQIRLDGINISSEGPQRRVRRRIGLVPQASNQGRGVFAELSVRDNLRLATVVTGWQEEIFERVLDLFPILATRLRSRAAELSGGQQQMLAVAIPLMAGSRVLLLDEPTSGLAIGSAGQLVDRIRHIATQLGVAVVMAEQNVKLAATIADRTYVLASGSVVREGTPDEVIGDNDLLDVL